MQKSTFLVAATSLFERCADRRMKEGTLIAIFTSASHEVNGIQGLGPSPHRGLRSEWWVEMLGFMVSKDRALPPTGASEVSGCSLVGCIVGKLWDDYAMFVFACLCNACSMCRQCLGDILAMQCFNNVLPMFLAMGWRCIDNGWGIF